MNTPESNADREPAEFQEDWLSAYLDGELAPEQVAIVEQRLASDASLQATLEDLQKVRQLVSDLPIWNGPTRDLDVSQFEGSSDDALDGDSSEVDEETDSHFESFQQSDLDSAPDDEDEYDSNLLESAANSAVRRAGAGRWIRLVGIAACLLAMLGVGYALWPNVGQRFVASTPFSDQQQDSAERFLAEEESAGVSDESLGAAMPEPALPPAPSASLEDAAPKMARSNNSRNSDSQFGDSPNGDDAQNSFLYRGRGALPNSGAAFGGSGQSSEIASPAMMAEPPMASARGLSLEDAASTPGAAIELQDTIADDLAVRQTPDVALNQDQRDQVAMRFAAPESVRNAEVARQQSDLLRENRNLGRQEAFFVPSDRQSSPTNQVRLLYNSAWTASEIRNAIAESPAFFGRRSMMVRATISERVPVDLRYLLTNMSAETDSQSIVGDLAASANLTELAVPELLAAATPAPRSRMALPPATTQIEESIKSAGMGLQNLQRKSEDPQTDSTMPRVQSTEGSAERSGDQSPTGDLQLQGSDAAGEQPGPANTEQADTEPSEKGAVESNLSLDDLPPPSAPSTTASDSLSLPPESASPSSDKSSEAKAAAPAFDDNATKPEATVPTKKELVAIFTTRKDAEDLLQNRFGIDIDRSAGQIIEIQPPTDTSVANDNAKVILLLNWRAR